MRVYGPTGAGAIAGNAPTRRIASGTFSLDAQEQPRAASQAGAPVVITGIDTLLALQGVQGVEEAAERRRRAVRRGRRVLDVLDSLKLGLLEGSLDSAVLAALKTTTAALAEPTGDPGLDIVLAEIALRAEVELAKIGMVETGQKRPE